MILTGGSAGGAWTGLLLSCGRSANVSVDTVMSNAAIKYFICFPLVCILHIDNQLRCVFYIIRLMLCSIFFPMGILPLHSFHMIPIRQYR